MMRNVERKNLVGSFDFWRRRNSEERKWPSLRFCYVSMWGLVTKGIASETYIWANPPNQPCTELSFSKGCLVFGFVHLQTGDPSSLINHANERQWGEKGFRKVWWGIKPRPKNKKRRLDEDRQPKDCCLLSAFRQLVGQIADIRIGND